MPSSSPPRRNTEAPRRGPGRRGFTLLEVLITAALLLVILVALLQFFDGVDHAWRAGAADPFAGAQSAFESMARDLADATLEPYQDYADAGGVFRTAADPGFVPDHLARRSDLAFVCGPAGGASGLLAGPRVTAGSAVFFAAPEGATQAYAGQGLARLLNAEGYFVEFGDDTSVPAFILALSHRYRWRLKRVLPPSESMPVYLTGPSPAWVAQLVPPGAAVPALVENVVALAVLPDRAAGDTGAPLAPAYGYDSRDTTNTLTLHQLPPRLRLALVAIDEPSAERLAAQNGANPPALVASGAFQQAAQLDADLDTLDAALTLQKISHRIYQREIQLPGSAWSGAAAQ